MPDHIWRTQIRIPSTGRETLNDNRPYNGYAYLIKPTPIAVAAQTGHYDPYVECPSDQVILRQQTSLRLLKQCMKVNVPALTVADSC